MTPPWPQPRQPALTPPAPASRTSSGTTPPSPPPPRSWPPRTTPSPRCATSSPATETALDRERAEQHKTVSLLHDIITSRPAAPASNGGQHPQADDGTGHQPAAAAGNGTSRRHARRGTAAAPQRPGHPRPGRGTGITSTADQR